MAQRSEPTSPDRDELLRFGLLLGALPLVFSPIYMLWEPYDALTGNVLAAATPGQLLVVVVDTILYSYSAAFLPAFTERPSAFIESFPTLMEAATMLGLFVILAIAAYRTRRSGGLR